VARLLVVLCLLLACAHDRGAAFTSADRDAIAGVLAAQREAWNRGDIEGFMVGYVPTDELVFTSGAAVRRGFAATQARYRERYVDAAAMGQLTFSELEINALGSDAAWVLGRWELQGTPEAGSGLFTLVFVRRAGRWLIVHDHTSAKPAV